MNGLRRILVLVLITLESVLASTAQTVVKTDQRKVENAEPIIVSVDATGRFKLGEKSLIASRLGGALKAALAERIPSERVIYIKAATKVTFSQIVKLLKAGRAIKHGTFGLIVDDKEGDRITGAVITKIILETGRAKPKPNPLYLGLGLQRNGRLSLNGEPHTASSLTTRLQGFFKARPENGVYVEGTQDVERTVFLVPSPATTFGAITQAARTVKQAGATPIGIEIDGPRPIVIEMTQIVQ